MYQYYFEKLDVFQRTQGLVAEIYKMTQSFPDEEKYSMVNQIRRASILILTNIAEGNSRLTKKDQAHFTTLSYSSLMELLSLIMTGLDLNYIEEKNYRSLRSNMEIIAKQLISLRKAQLKGIIE